MTQRARTVAILHSVRVYRRLESLRRNVELTNTIINPLFSVQCAFKETRARETMFREEYSDARNITTISIEFNPADKYIYHIQFHIREPIKIEI